MNEIVEALMKNEKPFGLMSEKMQEKAKEIHRTNFQYWHYDDKWEPCAQEDNNFQHNSTYRLRPDYKEEPEAVKCEVFKYQSKLYFTKNSTNKLLSTGCEYSDFIGFLYEDDIVRSCARIYLAQDGATYDYTDEPEHDKALAPTHVLFRKAKK